MDEQGLHVVFANAAEGHGFVQWYLWPDRSFQIAGRSRRVRLFSLMQSGERPIGRAGLVETIPSSPVALAEHRWAITVHVLGPNPIAGLRST